MDDLNRLNKNQIILLTLLVSFVTSIATGIVTITLIQQAPASVIQPVNRVILRTVETVVKEGKPQTIIKEVPVIVTEEQLIIKVINSASSAIVSISGTKSGTTTKSILSNGFLATSDGLIVASASAGLTTGQLYDITFNNQKTGTAEIISLPASPLALLRLKEPAADITPLALVTEDIAIGQTVVALGSTSGTADAVAVGIISGVTKTDNGVVSRLRTSAANIDNIGSPLLGVSGKVVGISEGAGVALSQAAIREAIDSIKK